MGVQGEYVDMGKNTGGSLEVLGSYYDVLQSKGRAGRNGKGLGSMKNWRGMQAPCGSKEQCGGNVEEYQELRQSATE